MAGNKKGKSGGGSATSEVGTADALPPMTATSWMVLIAFLGFVLGTAGYFAVQYGSMIEEQCEAELGSPSKSEKSGTRGLPDDEREGATSNEEGHERSQRRPGQTVPISELDEADDEQRLSTIPRVGSHKSVTGPAQFLFPQCSERGLPLESIPITARCIPPHRRCSRLVIDEFASAEETKALRLLLDWMLKTYGGGGGTGGPSLMDLNKGIISYKSNFANLHELMSRALKRLKEKRPDLSAEEMLAMATGGEALAAYKAIVQRIHREMTIFYLTDPETLRSEEERTAFYETHRNVLRMAPPTFFSRIQGGANPNMANDEYWHYHVDTEQYGTFAVTTLLYLNTQTSDEKHDTSTSESEGEFSGGEFLFGPPYPAIVEPRRGRLSSFTSGPENPHRVLKVKEGTRYALTSAFSCAVDGQKVSPSDPPIESFTVSSADLTAEDNEFLATLLNLFVSA